MIAANRGLSGLRRRTRVQDGGNGGGCRRRGRRTAAAGDQFVAETGWGGNSAPIAARANGCKPNELGIRAQREFKIVIASSGNAYSTKEPSWSSPSHSATRAGSTSISRGISPPRQPADPGVRRHGRIVSVGRMRRETGCAARRDSPPSRGGSAEPGSAERCGCRSSTD